MLKRLGKWVGESLPGKSGKKAGKDEATSRKLWDAEFSLVGDGGLDAEQVIAYVDDLKSRYRASQDAQEASVRSIVQTALADTHEIAEKIRTKAEKDAEVSASSVVAQAKRDAEATKHRAETEANQAAEGIAAAADRNARLIEAEAQDKAVLFLLRAREQIEREVVGEFSEAYSRLTAALATLASEGKELENDLRGRREELLKSKVFELTAGDVPLIGSPAASDAEAPDTGKASKGTKKTSGKARKASATVEAEPADAEAPAPAVETEPVLEAEPTAEGPAADPATVESRGDLADAVSSDNAATSDDEAFSELTEEEAKALYIGEVDIVVPTPVDAKMMSQLHRYLQTTPEIKLVRTAGSMGRGTVVTIAIDKPVPLIDALSSRIPDAAIGLERRRGDSSPGLPGATKKIRMVPRTD